MDVEDIFTRVSSRVLEGVMFHDKLSNYYRFLAFDKIAKEHEHRFHEESKNYQKLCRYYVEHYNRLLPEMAVENPDVIPSSWFRAARQDVDAKTKLMGVIDGAAMWVNWEQDTKSLLQQASKELYDGGAVAASIVMDKFVSDVDKELAEAQQNRLLLDALDLATAMETQYDKH